MSSFSLGCRCHGTVGVVTYVLSGMVLARHEFERAVDVESLVGNMTLHEKLAFLHGSGVFPFTTAYGGELSGVPRLDIDSLRVNDGPQGWGDATHPWRLLFSKGTATQYPSNLAMGASWDERLVYEYAKSIGTEFRKKGANMVLGPGLNLHRVPWGGRNFEYMTGEDPLLGAKLGVQYVRGIQDDVPNEDGERSSLLACVKHFLFNNQEYRRTTASMEVPQQAERELYFLPFEAAVKLGNVGSAMCGYNKVNGTKECEAGSNLKKLLELKNDLFVMSDWIWAVYDGVEMLKAGVSTEMPWAWHTRSWLLESALSRGDLSLSEHVEAPVKRILRAMDKVGILRRNSVPGSASVVTVSEKTQTRARNFAAKSIVLLKNEPVRSVGLPVLPLLIPDETSTEHLVVQFFGCDDLATAPSMMSSGNARARKIVQVEEAVRARVVGSTRKVRFLEAGDLAHSGFRSKQLPVGTNRKQDERRIALVCGSASTGEGSDRKSIEVAVDIPSMLADGAAPTAIIVFISSPGMVAVTEEMERADAILVGFYLGEQTGNAVADVLFGEVGPQGKLPLTLPRSETQVRHIMFKDSEQYPGVGDRVLYKENLLVGYRWWQAARVTPAYSFGHGLGYGLPLKLVDPRVVVTVTPDSNNRSWNCALIHSVENPAGSPWKKAQSETVQVFVKRAGRSFLELHAWWRSGAIEPGQSLQNVEVALDGLWPPTEWSIETGAWTPTPGESELHVGFSLDTAIRVAVPRNCGSLFTAHSVPASASASEESNQLESRVQAGPTRRVTMRLEETQFVETKWM
eukprot:TRINITY_DN13159_c0_g1_i1.p1 TRINITY_DN13159_c0_g1~~TRINITY_DN13159_c0_g1_i1.p1  ORF type:complete len:798 (-),score=91.93 TRINITY_DN13159_c0_g1_i1:304-2697(-)